jgi:RNase P subunit RPR2
MKPCASCGGRKVKYKRDTERRITVRCEKCGAEVRTPYFTEDSARGFWNMKQHDIEVQRKRAEAAG